MEKVITITRKIQLLFNTSDKDQVKEWYKKLYEWEETVFRAANYISSHHYLQENVKDMIYYTEDVKKKLANIEKDEDGILTTSKQNSTYQMLSAKFKGNIPMAILACLNAQVVSVYAKERKKYWKGECSLRTYKRGMPIPIDPRNCGEFVLNERENYNFTLYGINFQTNFGRDNSGNRIIFDRSLKGEYKLCTSSIQMAGTKMFLLAVFQFEKDNLQLSPDVAIEASLSVDTPIIAGIGTKNIYIGSKEEFMYRRIAIQGALRRIQKGSRFNKGGKGREKKMQATEHFHDMERNYVNTRIHGYTRKLINLCIQNKAGVLILKNQLAKEEDAKANEFVLRNWSYYGMKEKIAYKAAKAGIEVIVE